jgi:hypothetical protein
MSSQKKLISNSQLLLFTEAEMEPMASPYPSDSKRQVIEEKFKGILHEELELGSLVSYV